MEGERHRGVFADALDEAISERGVSLAWLSRRLAESGNPVGVSTLSYWRAGRRRPEHVSSLAALDELERLLGLEPGPLAGRLGPSPRLGPAGPERRMKPSASVTTGLRALGFERLVELEQLMTHVVIDFDAEGEPFRFAERGLRRARHDGVSRDLMAFAIDDGDGTEPALESHHGFRPGRTYFDVEDGVWLQERLLDRTLGVGAEILLESSVLLPRDRDPDHYYAHLLPRRGDAMIWLRFHPGRVPTHCECFTKRDGSVEATTREMDGRTTVHYSQRTKGPATVGIRWFW